MRASQTVLPFKLAASDESLTAHAGLALFGEYLRAMGITGLINHELPGAGSTAGYDPSAHILPLVLMLAGGGRTLEVLIERRKLEDCLRTGLTELKQVHGQMLAARQYMKPQAERAFTAYLQAEADLKAARGLR